MTDIIERLREGITLYSAAVENGDNHMKLLSDAADVIEKLQDAEATMSNDELASAIEVAHDKVNRTGTAWAHHTPWVEHLRVLLKEQQRRATHRQDRYSSYNEERIKRAIAGVSEL